MGRFAGGVRDTKIVYEVVEEGLEVLHIKTVSMYLVCKA